MTESILEARKAYIHNEVPVGGLIVDNTTKSILVRGYNKMNNSLNDSIIDGPTQVGIILLPG